MSNFIGRLTVANDESSLSDATGQHLIFSAGIPDSAQATAAATQFLLDTRHFSLNQMILIIGDMGNIGGIDGIVMVDAQPVAMDEAAFIAAASRVNDRRGAKKRGSRKGSKKAASKKTASKKTISKKAASKKAAKKTTKGKTAAKAAGRAKTKSTKKQGGRS